MESDGTDRDQMGWARVIGVQTWLYLGVDIVRSTMMQSGFGPSRLRAADPLCQAPPRPNVGKRRSSYHDPASALGTLQHRNARSFLQPTETCAKCLAIIQRAVSKFSAVQTSSHRWQSSTFSVLPHVVAGQSAVAYCTKRCICRTQIA